MPKFKVQFPNTVKYLDGHPKEVSTNVLIINAPSAQAALIHAYRVVVGDVGEPEVFLDDTTPAAPAIEVENA